MHKKNIIDKSIIDIHALGREIITNLKSYSFVITLLGIITLFFIILNPQALALQLITLFTHSTLLNVALKENFIFGTGLGFTILFILSFSNGIRIKYNPRTTLIQTSIVVFLLIWSALLTETIFTTSHPLDIIKWSNIFMSLDKTIFGTYPVFFMYSHYNIVFERIIVWSYNLMTIFLSLWTLFLIVSQRLEEFMLWSRRIILALALCIPLWIIFPAIQPSTMYVVNPFNQTVPLSIASEISKGPPSLFINQYSLAYTKMWIDPAHKRFSVSNFPSMHTIWGFLLLLSVINVFHSRRSTIFVALLACANMLGAIYTMQHYAVDVLAGIAVVIVVYFLTKQKSLPEEVM